MQLKIIAIEKKAGLEKPAFFCISPLGGFGLLNVQYS